MDDEFPFLIHLKVSPIDDNLTLNSYKVVVSVVEEAVSTEE